MSVTKRGNKYLARVSRQVDGKQKEVARRFRLQKDAQRWEREQKAKIERCEWVQPSKQTLNTFLDGWLAGVQEAKQRTREHYRTVLDLYIRPTLGNVPLYALDPITIRKALADLTARGYAPRTVQAAHGALRVALSAAVEDRLLIGNPAAARRMVPPMRRREQRVLSRIEVRGLLAATAGDRLGALWNLLVMTGLRPGEALGLTWDDVDFSAKVVRVRRALVPQKKDATGRTWRLEDCKTARSRRAVPLPPPTVEALARHRDRQAVERVIAGDAYAAHNFVFADDRGEPLRGDVVYRSHFRRALRAAGIPLLSSSEMITLYTLRHTNISLLLARGTPVHIVAERVGHSSALMTLNVYAHALSGQQEDAAEALARYIAEP